MIPAEIPGKNRQNSDHSGGIPVISMERSGTVLVTREKTNEFKQSKNTCFAKNFIYKTSSFLFNLNVQIKKATQHGDSSGIYYSGV
jgi:hypothetical protein